MHVKVDIGGYVEVDFQSSPFWTSLCRVGERFFGYFKFVWRTCCILIVETPREDFKIFILANFDDFFGTATKDNILEMFWKDWSLVRNPVRTQIEF